MTSERYPGMTVAEKAQCLELAELLDRVKQTRNGMAFSTDLLIAMASKAGLVLVDETEWKRLMQGDRPWLPLASAPKTGDWIFLFVPGHGPARARWVAGWISHANGREITRATHWRPLPADPVSEAA